MTQKQESILDKKLTLTEAQEQGIAPWKEPILETDQLEIYEDAFPVSEGHVLIVPKTYTLEHLTFCMRYAVGMGQLNVDTPGNGITGYNVGINMGESAGQTVMYPHVHLIFRRDGDTPDPTGGVRNVIAGKGNYKNEN